MIKRYEGERKSSIQKRKQMSVFTDLSFEGDFEAVYLNKVQRTTNDANSERFHELNHSQRYGMVTERGLLELEDLSASKSEMEQDDKLKEARHILGLQ